MLFLPPLPCPCVIWAVPQPSLGYSATQSVEGSALIQLVCLGVLGPFPFEAVIRALWGLGMDSGYHDSLSMA